MQDSASISSISRIKGPSVVNGLAFLQSPFWGKFKRTAGWKDRLLKIGLESGLVEVLVLEKKLKLGFTFAYVPGGPRVLHQEEGSEAGNAAILTHFAQALRASLSPGCIFIRFDPPWAMREPAIKDENDPVPGESRQTEAGTDDRLRSGQPSATVFQKVSRPWIGTPLRRASADVQPPDTVMLDLSLGKEQLLASMKSKWRYNIRLSMKKGIIIEELRVADTPDRGAAAISRFYELYKITSIRDGIALHPESYYTRLACLAAENREADLRIWFAKAETTDIACIITLFMEDEAVYLYGASSDEHRNLMPAYALQWAAIQGACCAGCLVYDFYGIPPNADPSHPMAGLYRFKTGFGGEILHRSGSWDYDFLSLPAMLFRVAESGRAFWYKRLVKYMAQFKRNMSLEKFRAFIKRN